MFWCLSLRGEKTTALEILVVLEFYLQVTCNPRTLNLSSVLSLLQAEAIPG
jgi:hypothetical protein